MKKSKILIFLFLISAVVYSQTVPVTFHFKPPDNVAFTKLRLVGSFNNWNNNDAAMEMTGPNGYGEYEITTSLAINTDHNYKFCMDANWGFAYADPDNPRINIADNNNSMVTPKNPMITYLLPRDVNTKGEEFTDNTYSGMPIRAIFDFTSDKPIDPSKITLTIDGIAIANPSQYYNSARKELVYQPNPALTKGEHTVSVSITSGAGTDQKTSKFIRNPDFVVFKVPTDFYYDQNNKTVTFLQTLTDVALVGAFNNWNDALNPMKDSDGDGLWEATANLDPGANEYKFKLNKINWVNDPDWPLIGESADGNSVVYAVVDSMASLKLIQPSDTKVFHNDTTISFKAILRPGVKSKGVDASSVKIKADDKDAASTFDVGSSTVSANILLSGNGRHTVSATFKNVEGVQASQTFTYGINNAPKGLYAVDGANDEEYKYPSGVADGAADILSVSINETTNHDSLKFSILMRNIDARTRLGVLISNPSSNIISDPRQLDIKLQDWTGQGVFASIGIPGNAYENTAVENRFMVSVNPDVYDKRTIKINSDASAKKQFEFTVSLQFLDSLMGSWKQQRQIGVFSYLAAADKSGNGYEVTAADGGSAAAEDPDIYDAAFIRGSFWQKRMFESYIAAGQKNGPKNVALDGAGRGLVLVNATEISDSLAHFGTDITFLTPPATYWYSNLVVHGELSDTTINSITFVFNSVQKTYTITKGKFDIPVTLNEGSNTAYVMATDGKGFKSVSKDLILIYKQDKQPVLTIDGVSSKRQVTLTAKGTSPVNSPLQYFWAPEDGNPATVTINSSTETAVFSMPNVDGEYTIAAAVMDALGNISYARKIVVVAGDSVFVADDNYHAKWIDDAIFYEIYPRSFSTQGGFKGIADKIDQIKELGVNAIWLMPVFEGPTVHGYEITDYYALEKDYGTDAEFRDMLSTFKYNGIKVILDYVVNHTSVSHPFMQNVFQYRSYSPWADFYIWSGTPGNSNYAYYFDWSSLPNLNHNNPDVRKYFVDVARYWVQNYDIAGYRCDVAWGVQERNAQFWQEWRKAVKNMNPYTFLEAEANSSDSTFFQKRFDSANDWDFRNLLIGVLNGSNTIQELHNQVIRSYPSYARPFRFMENHDETRAVAMFDGKRSLLTHTLVFTLGGIPLIYSGGEVGELTNRGMINWSDPLNLKPYFKRLIQIHKDYVHNPKIELISNNNPTTIYSYSATSSISNILVTAANFKETSTTVVLDLSKLPFSGTKDYYITDLFSGAVYKVPSATRNNIAIPLTGYQARVFFYGPDSLKVINAVNDDIAGSLIPKEFKLYQNYPNPFNPSSVIRYQTIKTGLVTLKVYDILGREVTTLVNEVKNPGVYECTFNGTKLSSGVYFYQLKTGDFVSTKKFTMIK